MRAAAFLIALTLGGAPRVAAADDAAAEKEIAQQAMERYFAGEKRGGLTLGAMGATGLAAGAILATRDDDLARGAGYVGLGFGVVHIAAGIFVYATSARRVDRFTAEIARDASAFAGTEATRVVGVKRQFTALKIVEGVLIAGGAGAAVYGLLDDRDLVAGIGIGVAVESAATLVFDIVASRRAGRYLRALRGISVVADDRGAPSLSLRLSF